MSPPAALLEVRQMKVAYGGIQAVKGISLSVGAGEMVGLIGANGAGKSTTLKALCGLEPLAGGELFWEGQALHRLPPWERVRLGLVMVPEGRGIFARMSIEENLKIGAYLLPGKTHQIHRERELERIYTLFPRLKERRQQWAGTLSGGEQQMLAMGRALMARPRLLLLDEPSMGLSPIMVNAVFKLMEQIHHEGVSVLLVEQNANRALSLVQRALVMDSGLLTLSGPAHELLKHPGVRSAYLGEVSS
jgi:branched-chain amino acid transport system ATP-binding protein